MRDGRVHVYDTGAHRIGGFSAPGGRSTKERLLALEGVHVGTALLPGLFETDR